MYLILASNSNMQKLEQWFLRYAITLVFEGLFNKYLRSLVNYLFFYLMLSCYIFYKNELSLEMKCRFNCFDFCSGGKKFEGEFFSNVYRKIRAQQNRQWGRMFFSLFYNTFYHDNFPTV